MGEQRTMLVLAHTGKENALRSARLVIERLIAAGVAVRVTDDEVPALRCAGATVVPAGPGGRQGRGTGHRARRRRDAAARRGDRPPGAAPR